MQRYAWLAALSVAAMMAWLAPDLSGAATSGPAAGGRVFVVNASRSGAADTNAGTEDSPLKTINAAAGKAQAGDAILVHAGVYRERVTPPRGGVEGRPITYQAAEPHEVFVRASDLYAGQWQPVSGKENVYTTTFAADLLKAYNPYKIIANGTRTHTLGQVFVDGRALAEQDTEAAVHSTPGSWRAAGGGSGLVVNFGPGPAPDQRQIEITTRNVCFAPKERGLGYITVTGFVFEHAANPSPRGFYVRGGSQIGALSCRSGHHWVIENNIVRWAKMVGIDVGMDGRDLGDPPDHERRPVDQVGFHLIRNNVVSDNGACGICGLRHTGVKVIGNVIERNGYLGLGGAEAAGVKFHLSVKALIEGNLVRDNDANGIWLDNHNADSRVTRNVVIGSEAHGIFVEMANEKVLCDNNVVAFTRYGGYALDPCGDGLYTHDAGGVTFAHNLSYRNAQFGAIMRIVTNRVPLVSNQRYLNNLLLDNPAGDISIPYPGPKARDNASDGNVFAPGKFPPGDNKKDPGASRFVVTTLGGTRMDAIKAAFEKACPGDAFRPAQNREARRGQSWVLLTLDEWRKLMNCDTGGRAATLGAHKLDADKLVLELEIDDAPWQAVCAGVADVTKDFAGKPAPRIKPLPGPWQDLKKGRNTIAFWPVSDIGPNPPPAGPSSGKRQSVSGSSLEE